MKVKFSTLTGIVAMSLIITLVACSKEDDPQPEPTTPAPSTTNYTYFFKATINGKSVDVGEKKLNTTYANGMTGSGSGDGDSSYQVVQSTYLAVIKDPTKPSYSVGMISTFHGYFSPPDYKTRAAAIKIGNHSYGNDDPMVESDGAIIEYWDGTKNYSTNYGSGNQTGSTFKITSYTDNKEGTSAKIIEAEFSCTLYDEAGSSIKLTNGKVKGRIVLF